MDNRRNYYRILNVQPDAPVEIIRASYRTLMQVLKQHPDLGGDHASAALINEAFATLSDPARRGEYDDQLLAADRQARTGGADYEKWKQRSATQRTSASHQSTGQNTCLFCQSPHHHGKAIPTDAACSNCHSPLFPAPSLQVAESDRRAIGRIAKHHAISFYAHWPQAESYSGQTEDLSHNGMRFATGQAVANGAYLKIECNACSAVAEVTHCEKLRSGFRNQYMVGVQFASVQFKHSHGTFVSRDA